MVIYFMNLFITTLKLIMNKKVSSKYREMYS